MKYNAQSLLTSFVTASFLLASLTLSANDHDEKHHEQAKQDKLVHHHAHDKDDEEEDENGHEHIFDVHFDENPRDGFYLGIDNLTQKTNQLYKKLINL